MLEAHEVIGMDEDVPSSFTFNPQAYVLVDLASGKGGWIDPKRCPECGRAHGFHHTGCPNEPRRAEFTRAPLGADEAFPVLDAAYDAGVESDAVFLAWLHRVDVPKCEAREHIAAWRSTHPDPWIWAHSYSFDNEAEMACSEGA